MSEEKVFVGFEAETIEPVEVNTNDFSQEENEGVGKGAVKETA